MKSFSKLGWWGIFASFALSVSSAQAGVFSTVHFVDSGEFAVGLEPELVLSNGAGIGVNLRYTQGLSDLMNGTFLIGTGSGPRRFRVGGNATFDFFPDIEGQPGIGLATQGIYYRLPNSGQLELTAVPYIHKTFPVGTNGEEVEPFFAFPIGFAFSGGEYKTISNVAIGALFKNTEHLRYVMEIGVNVNRSESYVSGGVIYYH